MVSSISSRYCAAGEGIPKELTRLSWLIAVLALVAAGIGLFHQGGGHTFLFTTLHGQTVQVYGQGLYHYDTVTSCGSV